MDEDLKGFKIAGFVLGLISTITGGLLMAILGLVFSGKCRNRLKETGEKDGLVTAGFVLSIIGLARTIVAVIIVFAVFFMSMFAMIASSSSSSYPSSSYSSYSSSYSSPYSGTSSYRY